MARPGPHSTAMGVSVRRLTRRVTGWRRLPVVWVLAVSAAAVQGPGGELAPVVDGGAEGAGNGARQKVLLPGITHDARTSSSRHAASIRQLSVTYPHGQVIIIPARAAAVLRGDRSAETLPARAEQGDLSRSRCVGGDTPVMPEQRSVLSGAGYAAFDGDPLILLS